MGIAGVGAGVREWAEQESGRRLCRSRGRGVSGDGGVSRIATIRKWKG